MPANSCPMLPLTEELLRALVAAPTTLAHHPLLVEANRQAEWAGPFVLASRFMFATLEGERVRAAGGLLPRWPGRAVAWTTLTEGSPQRDIGHVAYWLQYFMDLAQAEARWSRIEMTLRADLPWCDEFARLTGMTCEGTLRAYDTLDRDYKLFARVGGPAVSAGTSLH